jgi:heme o synthase
LPLKCALAVTTLPLAPPLSSAPVRVVWSTTIGALIALTKPQLAFMSVLTAMVAYGTAHPAAESTLATLIGTTLSAAGALSLNQWWERRADAQMRRTRNRPLPQGHIAPAVALAWSIALAAAGVGLLMMRVNVPAAGIAALTIFLYGFVYTPLKRRTRWATELGAVSGALPPLLGNAAAGDLWAAPGVALAAVLLCWQMPHFFAIGWRHRADYRTAGFRVLPAVDVAGKTTARWSLFYAAVLLPVSVTPWALGALGAIYGVTATVAGALFFGYAWQFATASGDRDAAARRLFLASIIYLPILLGALTLDRLIAR